MQHKLNELLARVDELETKITFQDALIEELNQTIIQQQFALDKMQIQLRLIAQKLQDVRPSNIAKLSEETPPPHY